jgi:hypothetical protein
MGSSSQWFLWLHCLLLVGWCPWQPALLTGLSVFCVRRVRNGVEHSHLLHVAAAGVVKHDDTACICLYTGALLLFASMLQFVQSHHA